MSDPKDLGSHMRYHHSLWYQKQQQQQLSNVSEQVDSVEGMEPFIYIHSVETDGQLFCHLFLLQARRKC